MTDEHDRRSIPIATAPIVCTLAEGEVQERRRLFEWVRANLTGLDRTDHGLLLHLPAGREIADELERFADAEMRCCRFFGLAVEAAPTFTTLRWDAPPAAADLADALLRWFRGDPGADLGGLL